MNNNLPQSHNPNEQEKIWRKFWEDEQIYKFDEKSDKPIFSVDTPPPYVSAEHLHAGHIMSYSQAEFVVRYKRMRGFNVFYPMGFDDNGLPTERYVEKKYKINKNQITRSEFIQKCLEETKLGAQNYKNLWTLLGISVDWSKTYSTINKHSQKISQWSFLDLYKKNLIQRRTQPIHWCVNCQTALAQADLEDREESSFLNYIEFSSENGQPLLISTSRPELIPACAALFYNPQDERYQNLKNKKAIVPILNYEIPIMEDESVNKEFGTGLMMVCTFGDMEDITKWKKHNLETRALFDEKGIVQKIGGKYEGIKISKLREQILEDLKQEGKLKKQEPITHVLNAHERCDTPVEFILTKQWFINLLDHKDEFLKRGKELNWFPQRMQKKYEDWVSGLKWDWCISRQRYYGVSFPVWHCKDCEEIILSDEKNLPADPVESKPPISSCLKCGSANIIPEKDVMDTWMTSSLSPIIGSQLVENEKIQKKLYPSTLRPQGMEIIRTWLFYTIVKSHFHHNILPFRDAMISGHGTDEKGKKISKRLGNYVEPSKIIGQYGADAVRYWATGAMLGENLRYNEDEIKKGKKTATKLLNAAKFVSLHITNTAETGLQNNSRNPVSKETMDKWVLGELFETIKKTTDYFENYEYSKARDTIDHFFWNIFTDNYLELAKHRLYNKEETESLQAAQKTLCDCLLAITKLYAPILPFITEEIYQALFKKSEKSKSVHISSWPEPKPEWQPDKEIKKDFREILSAMEQIRKFKSEQNISLAKEIDEFEIRGSEKLEKHKKIIEKTLHIKTLKVKIQ